MGSAVTQRLAGAGYGVRTANRGALTDATALRALLDGVGLCVHCAASRSGELDECRRVNVDATARLVDAALAAGVPRLVHVSTLSVYDDAAGPEFDEDSALWTAPGGRCLRFHQGGGGEGRPCGGGERTGHGHPSPRHGHVDAPALAVGPLALERARTSEQSILPFPEIPYVHVENLADAVVLAATEPAARGRAYNAIDGVADTADYLAAVYGAIGRPSPGLPPDAPRLRFSADRIRRELGYAPVDRWPAFLQSSAKYLPPVDRRPPRRMLNIVSIVPRNTGFLNRTSLAG